MRGTVIIAEAGTVHPDGTFSLLRGFINDVSGPELPVSFTGKVVLLVEATPSEQGPHSLELRNLDDDGKDTGGSLKVGFDVPAEGGHVALAFSFSMEFKNEGKTTFELRIDGELKHTTPLAARVKEQTT